MKLLVHRPVHWEESTTSVMRLINNRIKDKGWMKGKKKVSTDELSNQKFSLKNGRGLSSALSAQCHLKRLLIQHGFSEQRLEEGILLFKELDSLYFGDFYVAKLLSPIVKGGV